MTQQEVFDLLNGSLIDKRVCYDDLWEFCRSHGLEMFSGETRYCIASKDWDFVLKISRFDNVRDDYNAIEFANYENACKLGIEKIFLKMWKFGTLDCGLDIYAQVRYSFAHSGIDHNKEKKIRKQTEKIRSCKVFRKSHEHAYDGYRISNNWYARAYQPTPLFYIFSLSLSGGKPHLRMRFFVILTNKKVLTKIQKCGIILSAPFSVLARRNSIITHQAQFVN